MGQQKKIDFQGLIRQIGATHYFRLGKLRWSIFLKRLTQAVHQKHTNRFASHKTKKLSKLNFESLRLLEMCLQTFFRKNSIFDWERYSSIKNLYFFKSNSFSLRVRVEVSIAKNQLVDNNRCQMLLQTK